MPAHGVEDGAVAVDPAPQPCGQLLCPGPVTVKNGFEKFNKTFFNITNF